MRNYIYIGLGKSVNVLDIDRAYETHLPYEKFLLGDDHSLFTTYTSEGNGIATDFIRHLRMTDDDWVISASYNILKDLGCEDTGFVVVGEVQSETDDRVQVLDNAFKISTDLVLNLASQDDINFIKESIRSDVKILGIESLKIDGIPHTKFKLDKPLLTQVCGKEADKYVDIVRELI